MCFERPATAASSSEVEVESSPAVDVTMAWSGERVRVDLSVAGVLPRQAWTIDVGLWLDGEIAPLALTGAAAGWYADALNRRIEDAVVSKSRVSRCRDIVRGWMWEQDEARGRRELPAQQ
jgi:hypothetical protein